MNNNLFGEEIVRIESFTEKGKFYEVNKKRKTCTCPHHQKRGVICKHIKKVLGIDKETVMKRSIFTISLLKSALQKAVRRNKVDEALIYAKEMVRIDVVEFLRRFLIIIIEDCLLHYQYDELVGILKNYKLIDGLTDEQKNLILKVVYEVASCKYRENWLNFEFEQNITDDLKNTDKYLFDNKNVINEIEDKEKKLVDAVLYRSNIGGMKEDMYMLKNCAKIWLYRFHKKEFNVESIKKYFKDGSHIKFKDIKKIKKGDMILEAVDYHISPLVKILLKKPYITNLINKYYPNNKDIGNILEGIIWKCRSGVSDKKELTSNKSKDWYGKIKYCYSDSNRKEVNEYIYNQIKDEVNRISNWFISKQ